MKSKQSLDAVNETAAIKIDKEKETKILEKIKYKWTNIELSNLKLRIQDLKLM